MQHIYKKTTLKNFLTNKIMIDNIENLKFKKILIKKMFAIIYYATNNLFKRNI